MVRKLGFSKKLFKLWNSQPIKALSRGDKSRAGHNDFGRITVFHRGRRRARCRLVDFYRHIFLPGIVRRLESDPHRSSFLALVCYQNGLLSYIPATVTMKIGQFVLTQYNSKKVLKNLQTGFSTRLSFVPPGTKVSSLALQINGPGIIGRSAGLSAQVLRHHSNGLTTVRMPSKEQRLVSSFCSCTVGEVSNANHRYTILGSAGTARRLGRRPIVRGLAMNQLITHMVVEIQKVAIRNHLGAS